MNVFPGIIVDDVLAPNRAKDGSLYRIDPDGTTNKVASGIVCSNGLCWDLKEKAFYYIDSLTFTVQRFDYDVETGNISNPTVAFSFEKHGLTSSPDGMTIDTDGNLWVAAFWETGMLKIDPRQNKVVEKIPLPVAQVASATFGGPNLDVLYVTTASLALEGRPEQHPPAGSTYAITGMNARGYPNLKVRLY
ncbi:regucalcin-like [Trichoplusia ni]|uniref:Regucalcin n=1 Tax=Trichoplusia ni TaxID=7111 RepID=A0A7E5W831_TRINI|nr:regucalcin-like [Trichoplusia ni]